MAAVRGRVTKGLEMDTELLGLPAEAGTALALIATGVIVPAVTAMLSSEKVPSKYKRLIPIGLAAAGAAVIVILQGGGPLAEQLLSWIVVAGVVVGMAQTLYAAMPRAWKGLESLTSRLVEDEVPPSGLADEAPRGQDGPNTHVRVSEDPEGNLSPQSGLESPEGSDDFEPYRQRTLNQPEGDEGYPRE